MPKPHVLFVCHGNIHRSAIAEAILRRLLKTHNLGHGLTTSSRGLCGATPLVGPPQHKNLRHYPAEWAASEPALREFRVDLNAHEARPITAADVDEAAIILAMERRVLDGLDYSLIKLFPDARPRMRLFLELDDRSEDIPDMYGNSAADAHRAVVATIADVLKRRFVRLTNWVESNLEQA